MIGTTIKGTLWYVEWTHLPVDPIPGLSSGPVKGHLHVVTADPSGRDLFEIAEVAVLNGKARPELEFTVVEAKRLVEVKGRAIAVGGVN